MRLRDFPYWSAADRWDDRERGKAKKANEPALKVKRRKPRDEDSED